MEHATDAARSASGTYEVLSDLSEYGDVLAQRHSSFEEFAANQRNSSLEDEFAVSGAADDDEGEPRDSELLPLAAAGPSSALGAAGAARVSPEASFNSMCAGQHDESCVLQFATATFFCEESELSFSIDIVRIGPAHLPVRVSYASENGSAVAGVNFEAASGDVLFEPGVIMRTVVVRVLPSQIWNPTLDFSMKIMLDPHVTHARLT